MDEAKYAAFALEGFRFTEAHIWFYNKRNKEGFSLGFSPSGIYFAKDSRFELTFKVLVSTDQEEKDKVLELTMVSNFKFSQPTKFEDIPPYFYKNSIAIIFPFVRSFASTLSLQANGEMILLPTMNLTSLENPLKNSTVQVE